MTLKTVKNVVSTVTHFDTKACIKKIDTIAFSGDIIPSEWHYHVVTKKGSADMPAIALLAKIIFHYRSIARPFQGDMWQQSHKELMKALNFTKSQVASGLSRLEKMGLIVREFRAVDTVHGRLWNVQFIAPVADKVCAISLIKMPTAEVLDNTPALSEEKKADKIPEGDENNRGGYPEKQGYPHLEKQGTLQRPSRKKEEAVTLEALQKTLSRFAQDFSAAVAFLMDKKESEGMHHNNHSHYPTQKPPVKSIQSTEPTGCALRLVPEEGIIREALTENQKAYALEKIAQLPAPFGHSLLLPKEILAGLIDPQCFSGCGIDFHRKLNTILQSVKKETWTAPVSMLMTQKATEDKAEKARHHAFNEQKYLHQRASCDYIHWGKIAGFHQHRPVEQKKAIALQKKAWDELVRLTEVIRAQAPDYQLPNLPPEPQVTFWEKTA